MADPIQAAADELKRKINEHVEALKSHSSLGEIGRLTQALNGLEDVLKTPRTSLAGLLGIPLAGGGGAQSAAEDDVDAIVRFDEFVGASALEAAKKYLKKRKDARPFDEIVRAIKTGGGKIESEEQLRTGLTRSTLDVIKIGERFGALDNYPNVKRGGGKKRKDTADSVVEEPEIEVEETEPTT